jgi:hypothetical protein
MKIRDVEMILRSEGVALGGYSGNYEFWNMNEHTTKKGYWKGYARNLQDVMKHYKDFTDAQIHLYPKKMQDIVNRISIPNFNTK